MSDKDTAKTLRYELSFIHAELLSIKELSDNLSIRTKTALEKHAALFGTMKEAGYLEPGK